MLDVSNSFVGAEQAKSTGINIPSVWVCLVITMEIWWETFLSGFGGDEIWRRKSENLEIFFVSPFSSTTTDFCFLSVEPLAASFLL